MGKPGSLFVALGASFVALAMPLRAVGVPVQEQPAMAFDQIDRILLEGATPPPVNSFAADAATIGALPPLTAGAARSTGAAQGIGLTLATMAIGFIPFVGGFIAGAASRAANAAEEAAQARSQAEHYAAMMHYISAGSLSHFAFYHGWLRAEHAGRDVTIVKPDEGLTIILDLQKKTAQKIDARATETISVNTQEAVAPELVGEPVIEPLPGATIAGLLAHGYRTTGTLELSHGTGWCTPGRHRVTQVEYVAGTPDPQPPASPPPAHGLADVCQPSSTASYREPGRLVVYRATTFEPGTSTSVSLMFERANIGPFVEQSAALFAIPSDFTQEQ